MSKPRIILAMPNHVGLMKIISDSLTHHSFEVLCFDQLISPERFKYPNLYSRIYKGYRKLVYNDRDYKTTLRDPQNTQYIEEKLQQWGGYADYTLVIRPDVFSQGVLELLKARTRGTFAGYQWDGLTRFPSIFSRIKLFDRFFVFDPQDYQHQHNARIFPITNFCVEHALINDKETPSNKSPVVYFVGYHNASRQQAIEQLVGELSKHEVEIKCLINHAPANAYNHLPILKIKDKIDFNDNLANVQQADILIDLVIGEHTGLSFRTFEALFFKKKFISNNASIVHYDFYHPDNILLWDGKDDGALQRFLAVPYNTATDDIAAKYHFGNWIRYVLDIGDYTPITLPILNMMQDQSRISSSVSNAKATAEI